MVKMIKPKPYSSHDIRAAIDMGLRAADAEVEVNFQLSYWNWDRENWPDWDVKGPMTQSGSRLIRRTTVSTPFIWVDQGTPPHKITAKNAPVLRFREGFSPMTQPGRLVASMGGSFGGWVSAKEVQHPGTKARDISEEVKKRADESLPAHIDKFLSGVV